MSNDLIGRIPFISPATFEMRQTQKPAVSHAKQKEKLPVSIVDNHREELRTEDQNESKDFLEHVLKQARNAHIDQQKHQENSLITKMQKGIVQDVAIEAKY
ncbi:MAG: hypothetical protein KBD37_03050, partial [Burkholderiales bacterium]|nr:hypothetical protein [Burkholderiales bacterium]